MKCIKITLLLSVLAASSGSLFSQVMKPEDLWKMGRVSDPQVSPDGKEVLYTVRSYDLAANKGNSDLWKVVIATRAAIRLTTGAGNETSAKWSADGKKVFYLDDQSGTSCLYSMMPNGSSMTEEARLDGDINAYGIAASGNKIWFAMDVKVAKTARDKYPDLPKATGRLYDDLMYRHWDRWDDGTYSHVFVASMENGKVKTAPQDIMAGETFDCPMKPMDGEEQISWSPDGSTLAYTSKKLDGRAYAMSTNSEIYLYDTEKKTTRNITEGMPGYDKNPLFSPDGKSIIWMSQHDAGNEADRRRIFLMDLVTNQKRELTQGFDNDVEETKWSVSGQRIYMVSGIQATVQVFVCEPFAKTPKPITQLTSDEADHSSLSVAGNASTDYLVTSRMSISQPNELYSIDPKTGVSKQLTFTNSELLASLKLAKVEKRMVKSTDGKSILTWVIYPPDFDATKKYPALLYCQGGPQSTVSQFFSYRWNFQLMAAHGYIIVAPNRRGVPSFGEKWNDDISGDWGGQCMQDLLSAIDSVSKEPFIDKNRLGCVGASFGGFSSFWLEGHHNKRFKAFIAHDGVFNFESMFGATEETFFNNHEFGGAYWDKPQPPSYAKFSPHNFVDKWDTPILIITNEKDYRVPYEQGLEAYTAARVRNIPARLLVFPDENHWVLKPQNSVMWQRVFFDFLGTYLK